MDDTSRDGHARTFLIAIGGFFVSFAGGGAARLYLGGEPVAWAIILLMGVVCFAATGILDRQEAARARAREATKLEAGGG